MRLLLLFSLFFASLLRAEDIYIAQTQQGNGSGDSAANAKAVTFFNTAGNWGAGAGKISPGDTVHLCGTVTTKLDFQGSGTAGNVITLYFESGAKMSSAAWDSNGAINIFQYNYLTIDGGTNGVIENTANGTLLANQVSDSLGIKAQSSSNLTIQNLTISNIYVRVSGTTTDGGSTAAISNQDSNGLGTSNFTVTNCTIHDVYIGIQVDCSGAGSSYTFSGITAYNCNWGGGTSDRSGSTAMTGITLTNSTFYNWTNWDETATNAFHHNGWHFYTASGGYLSGVTIKNCTFGKGWGGAYQTAGIFCEGDVRSVSIYNNLFKCDAAEYAGNGYVALTTQVTTGTTHLIANNTTSGAWNGEVFHLYGSQGAYAITFNVKNNIGQGVTGIALYYNAHVTLNSDYNDWYSLNATNTFSTSANGSGVFKTYAQWLALGQDANSITSNPTLNGSYGLSAGSPAIGTGTDLSAYFTTDAAGYTRTVPWDIGAYKYIPPTTSLTGIATMSGNASFK